MSQKSSTKRTVSHKLNETLWNGFLHGLETKTLTMKTVDRDFKAMSLAQKPITIDIAEPNNDSDVETEEPSNVTDATEIVILSSDSENENDNNVWRNKRKAKCYQQLWEQTRYLVFHRLTPSYAWARFKDSSLSPKHSRIVMEEGLLLFPYSKFQSFSDGLKKFVNEYTLNSEELNFLWNNVIQWILAIKVSSDPLHLNNDERFSLILVDLMVQFVNYKLHLHCHVKANDEILKVVNQIMQTLSIVFNGNNAHTLMVLLRIKLGNVEQEYRHLLDPIFRKHLTDRSLGFVSNDFVVYLRLIFCFKRWKLITPLKTDREKINEIAVGQSVQHSEPTKKASCNECYDSILPKAVPKLNVQNQSFVSISDLIGYAIERKAIGTRTLLVNTSLNLDEAISKYFRLYEKYITRKTTIVSPTHLPCRNSHTTGQFLYDRGALATCSNRKNTPEKSFEFSSQLQSSNYRQQRQNEESTFGRTHSGTICDTSNKLSNRNKFNNKVQSDISCRNSSNNLDIIELDSTDDEKNDISVNHEIRQQSYSLNRNRTDIESNSSQILDNSRSQNDTNNLSDNAIVLNPISKDDSESVGNVSKIASLICKETNRTNAKNNSVPKNLRNITPRSSIPRRKEEQCTLGEVSSTTSLDNVEDEQIDSAGGYRNAREVGIVKAVDQGMSQSQSVVSGTQTPENEDDDRSSMVVVEEATSSTEVFSRAQPLEKVIFSTQQNKVLNITKNVSTKKIQSTLDKDTHSDSSTCVVDAIPTVEYSANDLLKKVEKNRNSIVGELSTDDVAVSNIECNINEIYKNKERKDNIEELVNQINTVCENTCSDKLVNKSVESNDETNNVAILIAHDNNDCSMNKFYKDKQKNDVCEIVIPENELEMNRDAHIDDKKNDKTDNADEMLINKVTAGNDENISKEKYGDIEEICKENNFDKIINEINTVDVNECSGKDVCKEQENKGTTNVDASRIEDVAVEIHHCGYTEDYQNIENKERNVDEIVKQIDAVCFNEYSDKSIENTAETNNTNATLIEDIIVKNTEYDIKEGYQDIKNNDTESNSDKIVIDIKAVFENEGSGKDDYKGLNQNDKSNNVDEIINQIDAICETECTSKNVHKDEQSNNDDAFFIEDVAVDSNHCSNIESHEGAEGSDNKNKNILDDVNQIDSVHNNKCYNEDVEKSDETNTVNTILFDGVLVHNASTSINQIDSVHNNKCYNEDVEKSDETNTVNTILFDGVLVHNASTNINGEYQNIKEIYSENNEDVTVFEGNTTKEYSCKYAHSGVPNTDEINKIDEIVNRIDAICEEKCASENVLKDEQKKNVTSNVDAISEDIAGDKNDSNIETYEGMEETYKENTIQEMVNPNAVCKNKSSSKQVQKEIQKHDEINNVDTSLIEDVNKNDCNNSKINLDIEKNDKDGNDCTTDKASETLHNMNDNNDETNNVDMMIDDIAENKDNCNINQTHEDLKRSNEENDAGDIVALSNEIYQDECIGKSITKENEYDNDAQNVTKDDKDLSIKEVSQDIKKNDNESNASEIIQVHTLRIKKCGGNEIHKKKSLDDIIISLEAGLNNDKEVQLKNVIENELNSEGGRKKKQKSTRNSNTNKNISHIDNINNLTSNYNPEEILAVNTLIDMKNNSRNVSNIETSPLKSTNRKQEAPKRLTRLRVHRENVEPVKSAENKKSNDIEIKEENKDVKKRSLETNKPLNGELKISTKNVSESNKQPSIYPILLMASNSNTSDISTCDEIATIVPDKQPNKQSNKPNKNSRNPKPVVISNINTRNKQKLLRNEQQKNLNENMLRKMIKQPYIKLKRVKMTPVPIEITKTISHKDIKEQSLTADAFQMPNNLCKTSNIKRNKKCLDCETVLGCSEDVLISQEKNKKICKAAKFQPETVAENSEVILSEDIVPSKAKVQKKVKFAQLPVESVLGCSEIISAESMTSSQSKLQKQIENTKLQPETVMECNEVILSEDIVPNKAKVQKKVKFAKLPAETETRLGCSEPILADNMIMTQIKLQKHVESTKLQQQSIMECNEVILSEDVVPTKAKVQKKVKFAQLPAETIVGSSGVFLAENMATSQIKLQSQVERTKLKPETFMECNKVMLSEDIVPSKAKVQKKVKFVKLPAETIVESSEVIVAESMVTSQTKLQTQVESTKLQPENVMKSNEVISSKSIPPSKVKVLKKVKFAILPSETVVGPGELISTENLTTSQTKNLQKQESAKLQTEIVSRCNKAVLSESVVSTKVKIQKKVKFAKLQTEIVPKCSEVILPKDIVSNTVDIQNQIEVSKIQTETIPEDTDICQPQVNKQVKATILQTDTILGHSKMVLSEDIVNSEVNIQKKVENAKLKTETVLGCNVVTLPKNIVPSKVKIQKKVKFAILPIETVLGSRKVILNKSTVSSHATIEKHPEIAQSQTDTVLKCSGVLLAQDHQAKVQFESAKEIDTIAECSKAIISEDIVTSEVKAQKIISTVKHQPQTEVCEVKLFEDFVPSKIKVQKKSKTGKLQTKNLIKCSKVILTDKMTGQANSELQIETTKHQTEAVGCSEVMLMEDIVVSQDTAEKQIETATPRTQTVSKCSKKLPHDIVASQTNIQIQVEVAKNQAEIVSESSKVKLTENVATNQGIIQNQVEPVQLQTESILECSENILSENVNTCQAKSQNYIEGENLQAETALASCESILTADIVTCQAKVQKETATLNTFTEYSDMIIEEETEKLPTEIGLGYEEDMLIEEIPTETVSGCHGIILAEDVVSSQAKVKNQVEATKLETEGVLEYSEVILAEDIVTTQPKVGNLFETTERQTENVLECSENAAKVYIETNLEYSGKILSEDIVTDEVNIEKQIEATKKETETVLEYREVILAEDIATSETKIENQIEAANIQMETDLGFSGIIVTEDIVKSQAKVQQDESSSFETEIVLKDSEPMLTEENAVNLSTKCIVKYSQDVFTEDVSTGQVKCHLVEPVTLQTEIALQSDVSLPTENTLECSAKRLSEDNVTEHVKNQQLEAATLQTETVLGSSEPNLFEKEATKPSNETIVECSGEILTQDVIIDSEKVQKEEDVTNFQTENVLEYSEVILAEDVVTSHARNENQIETPDLQIEIGVECGGVALTENIVTCQAKVDKQIYSSDLQRKTGLDITEDVVTSQAKVQQVQTATIQIESDLESTKPMPIEEETAKLSTETFLECSEKIVAEYAVTGQAKVQQLESDANQTENVLGSSELMLTAEESAKLSTETLLEGSGGLLIDDVAGPAKVEQLESVTLRKEIVLGSTELMSIEEEAGEYSAETLLECSEEIITKEVVTGQVKDQRLESATLQTETVLGSTGSMSMEEETKKLSTETVLECRGEILTEDIVTSQTNVVCAAKLEKDSVLECSELILAEDIVTSQTKIENQIEVVDHQTETVLEYSEVILTEDIVTSEIQVQEAKATNLQTEMVIEDYASKIRTDTIFECGSKSLPEDISTDQESDQNLLGAAELQTDTATEYSEVILAEDIVTSDANIPKKVDVKCAEIVSECSEVILTEETIKKQEETAKLQTEAFSGYNEVMVTEDVVTTQAKLQKKVEAARKTSKLLNQKAEEIAMHETLSLSTCEMNQTSKISPQEENCNIEKIEYFPSLGIEINQTNKTSSTGTNYNDEEIINIPSIDIESKVQKKVEAARKNIRLSKEINTKETFVLNRNVEELELLEMLPTPQVIQENKMSVQEQNYNESEIENLPLLARNIGPEENNLIKEVVAELKFLSSESPKAQLEQSEPNKKLQTDTPFFNANVEDHVQQKHNPEQTTKELLEFSIEKVLGANKDNSDIFHSPLKRRIDILTAEKINSTYEQKSTELIMDKGKSDVLLTSERGAIKHSIQSSMVDEISKKSSKSELNDVKVVSANVPEEIFADDECDNSVSDEIPTTTKLPSCLTLDDFNDPESYTESYMSTNATEIHCLEAPSFSVEAEIITDEQIFTVIENSKPEPFNEIKPTVNLPHTFEPFSLDMILEIQCEQSINSTMSGRGTQGSKTSTPNADPRVNTQIECVESNNNSLLNSDGTYLEWSDVDGIPFHLDDFADGFFSEHDKSKSRSNSFSNDFDSSRENQEDVQIDNEANELISQQKISVICDHSYNKDISDAEKIINPITETTPPQMPLLTYSTSPKKQYVNTHRRLSISRNEPPISYETSKLKSFATPYWITKKNNGKSPILERKLSDSSDDNVQCTIEVTSNEPSTSMIHENDTNLLDSNKTVIYDMPELLIDSPRLLYQDKKKIAHQDIKNIEPKVKDVNEDLPTTHLDSSQTDKTILPLTNHKKVSQSIDEKNKQTNYSETDATIPSAISTSFQSIIRIQSQTNRLERVETVESLSKELDNSYSDESRESTPTLDEPFKGFDDEVEVNTSLSENSTLKRKLESTSKIEEPPSKKLLDRRNSPLLINNDEFDKIKALPNETTYENKLNNIKNKESLYENKLEKIRNDESVNPLEKSNVQTNANINKTSDIQTESKEVKKAVNKPPMKHSRSKSYLMNDSKIIRVAENNSATTHCSAPKTIIQVMQCLTAERKKPQQEVNFWTNESKDTAHCNSGSDNPLERKSIIQIMQCSMDRKKPQQEPNTWTSEAKGNSQSNIAADQSSVTKSKIQCSTVERKKQEEETNVCTSESKNTSHNNSATSHTTVSKSKMHCSPTDRNKSQEINTWTSESKGTSHCNVTADMSKGKIQCSTSDRTKPQQEINTWTNEAKGTSNCNVTVDYSPASKSKMQSVQCSPGDRNKPQQEINVWPNELKRHSSQSSTPQPYPKTHSPHISQTSSRYKPYSKMNESPNSHSNKMKNNNKYGKPNTTPTHTPPTKGNESVHNKISSKLPNNPRQKPTQYIPPIDVSNIVLPESVSESISEKLKAFRRSLPIPTTYVIHCNNEKLVKQEKNKLCLQYLNGINSTETSHSSSEHQTKQVAQHNQQSTVPSRSSEHQTKHVSQYNQQNSTPSRSSIEHHAKQVTSHNQQTNVTSRSSIEHQTKQVAQHHQQNAEVGRSSTKHQSKQVAQQNQQQHQRKKYVNKFGEIDTQRSTPYETRNSQKPLTTPTAWEPTEVSINDIIENYRSKKRKTS